MSDGFGKSVVTSLRKCLGQFMRLSAPNPAREVMELLVQLEFTPRQISGLYATFQDLKRFDSLTLTTDEFEVSVESTFRLIRTKRKWVEKIMRLLLDLAGFSDVVTWDGYLYTLLQFCTLSKIELCQVLFFVISKSMKSWTVQYLTSTQLEEFYEDYRDCPIPSFNTAVMEFSKLPLAKYSMSDFIELMFRFSQLVNPCMHLQSELQHALPSMRFWTDYDRIKIQNRKIAIDFFRFRKVQSLMDVVGKTLTSADDDGQDDNSQYLQTATKDYREPHEVKEEIMKILANVKRGPGIKSDIPLPYSAVNVPIPYREKRIHAEILPAWLEEYMETNEELLGLKEARDKEKAQAALAQRLAIEKSQPKTLEAIRAQMATTYAQPDTKSGKARQGFTKEPQKRSADERMVEIKRHQELDFIRRNRRGENRRDNMVDILGRCKPCELIDRPIPKVRGV
jgi:hypothetical protein